MVKLLSKVEIDKDFSKYYGEYFERFVKQITGYFDGDVSSAEDVVQEGFAKAYLKWNDCHTSRAAWLGTTMRNTALNKIKSEKSNPIRFALSDEEDDDNGGVRTLSDTSPEEALECDEILTTVQANYEGLNPEFKRVFDLRESGSTYQEISDSLNIPINTVRTRLRRTTARLKRGI